MNQRIDGAVCGDDGCGTGELRADAPKTVDTGASRTVHKLTIVSDVICPWCFVGKKNLEKALILTTPSVALSITWRPFELNPAMPREGLNRRDYRSHKFGSWEQSQILDAQVADAGKQAGITFRHDLMERTPNTFDAHRLIWIAGEHGMQDAVVEALFRAYFIEGRDVGDINELADIGNEAGLSGTVIAAFREGTPGAEEVRREASASRVAGISGVPTFILDGKKLFSGAMKPEQMAARFLEETTAPARS